MAIVVAAGLGYWLLVPRIPSETVSSTTLQTSLLTSSTTRTSQTSTSSTAVTVTSTSSAASETTLWINVTAVKPVNYYLGLLDSNDTQPYVQLARELRKIPSLTNATAVAKITFLALNATNPEVKDAFELMIKGGTSDPRDFKYSIPSWNTELQVLYWLAAENDLRKDDTLALAIAMVNGFWLTIGNDEVKQTVQEDATALLGFFRETNQMQRASDYYELEDYPLEAKICLAWTASITPNFSALPLVWGVERYDQSRTLGYFANGTKATLEGYRWNTVSVATLRAMREIMTRNQWIDKDPSVTIPSLERYFYFSERHLARHSKEDLAYIKVDGRWVHDYTIGNVDWQLDFYVKTGKFQGECTDESQWTDAWAKSWGIATTTVHSHPVHFYPIFYDPPSRIWRVSEIQLGVGKEAGDEPLLFMIFRPPIDLRRYFSPKARTSFYPDRDWLYNCNPNMFYWYPNKLTLGEIRSMLMIGLQTSTLKRQVLYGQL